MILHSKDIAALATGAGAILGLGWKLKVGSRLERFGRWLYVEIRTLVYLRKELAKCRQERQIREGAWATTEATNLELLARVRLLVDLCGGSDSSRQHQPTQLPTKSSEDLRD